jgi:hypothetical protein
MVQLDGLIEKGIIPSPDFIKIDVEGAEMLVLNGSKNTLRTYHPKILLSTHGRLIHTQCIEFLKARGYNIVASDRGDIFSSNELLAY